MGNQNSGRKPKPTALKLLQGNPGQRKLNQDEPKPPEGPIEAPNCLSEKARQVWDEVAPICIQMGTLTPADVYAFAEYCELQATARMASAEKSEPGFSIFLHTTTVDSAGNEHQNVKVHPAIKIEGDVAVKLRPYYEYFGMTPSSRARLVVKKNEEPKSKWAGVLS